MADPVQELATVKTLSPLTVKTDPADTACPATNASGVTLAIGDRVRVSVEAALPPVVTGVMV